MFREIAIEIKRDGREGTVIEERWHYNFDDEVMSYPDGEQTSMDPQFAMKALRNLVKDFKKAA